MLIALLNFKQRNQWFTQTNDLLKLSKEIHFFYDIDLENFGPSIKRFWKLCTTIKRGLEWKPGCNHRHSSDYNSFFSNWLSRRTWKNKKQKRTVWAIWLVHFIHTLPWIWSRRITTFIILCPGIWPNPVPWPPRIAVVIVLFPGILPWLRPCLWALLLMVVPLTIGPGLREWSVVDLPPLTPVLALHWGYMPLPWLRWPWGCPRLHLGLAVESLPGLPSFSSKSNLVSCKQKSKSQSMWLNELWTTSGQPTKYTAIFPVS